LSKKNPSLTEKLIPEVTDNVGYVLDAVAKNLLYGEGIAIQSRVNDSYRAGRAQFHLHISWLPDGAGEIEPQDFCAIYRRLPLATTNLVTKYFPGWNLKTEGYRSEFLSYDDQKAMFIEDVQLRETPEDIVYSGIASIVRLQFLDFCEGIRSNEWFDFSICKIVELRLREINGERSFGNSVAASTIQDSQLTDHVIKGGTGVVNTITDDQRHLWAKLCRLFETNNQFLPFRIVLMPSSGSIRLRSEQGSQPRIQVREMVLCSADFGPCSE